MKPLTKSGGLVDFKENIVFEEYKEKVLKKAKDFRDEVKKQHGFEPSSDLYKRIINYQIKKYGTTLVGSYVIEEIKNFGNKKRTVRLKRIESNERKRKCKEFIERIDKKRGKNVSK